MPTYEYRCASGHEFEKMQRMSEDPIRECPQCGAPAERLLSAGGGLVFKGSGFYITDYTRSDNYKKSTAAESSASSGDSGSSKESTKESPKESPKESSKSSDSAPAPAPSSKPKTD